MSTSEPRNQRRAVPRRAIVGKKSRSVEFALPATVSRAALLDRGSDLRFRTLVYDLLTISNRMNSVREHLARRMRLSGPQYSVLMAIAQAQGSSGIGVGTVARLLHVSSAFIATETGKLAQAGLVSKRANPKDRRSVLLNVTGPGRSLIEANSAEIRAVNDLFFGSLDRAKFDAVASAAALLVQGSRKAMHRVHVIEDDAFAPLREAAE